MPYIASIGTYLPCWGAPQHRVAGDDEDAITLAVEAGRAALIASGAVERVVLVSRDLPLLESSNAAVLLAGLGLDPELEVDERLGRVPETVYTETTVHMPVPGLRTAVLAGDCRTRRCRCPGTGEGDRRRAGNRGHRGPWATGAAARCHAVGSTGLRLHVRARTGGCMSEACERIISTECAGQASEVGA
jgi:hypothetical protein